MRQPIGPYKDLLVQEENVIVVQGEEISPQANDSSWLEVSSSRDQRRRRKRRKEVLMRSSSSSNLAHLPVDSTQSAARKISAPVHSYSLPSESYKHDKTQEQIKSIGIVKNINAMLILTFSFSCCKSC